jgi:hypothetical protein
MGGLKTLGEGAATTTVRASHMKPDSVMRSQRLNTGLPSEEVPWLAVRSWFTFQVLLKLQKQADGVCT